MVTGKTSVGLLAPKIVDELDHALGPIPVLAGESKEDYKRLSQQIRTAVGPFDAVEFALVRDFIDHTWEILRLRRFKIGLILSEQARGMYQILRGSLSDVDARRISDLWSRGDQDATIFVANHMKKSGKTIDEVSGIAFSIKLEDIKSIENLIASLERRRSRTLNEVQMYRYHLAQRLRRAATEIEAQYEVNHETVRKNRKRG